MNSSLCPVNRNATRGCQSVLTRSSSSITRSVVWAWKLRARVTHTAPEVSRQAIIYVSRRAAYPNTRAREVLGWEPRVTLEEGMRRSEEWARAEGLLG